jgi:hypothetical protein
MAFPSYKEIIDLIKVGSTIEAQEKIMELRQSALAIQEQNIDLRNQLADLQAEIKELKSLSGEPCPRCKKKTWLVEKSEPDPQFRELGAIRRTFKCADCGLTESIIVTPH